MSDEKLFIALVGLPARGKSTLGLRLKEALRRDNIPTRIFNNGNLRRAFHLYPAGELLSHRFHTT